MNNILIFGTGSVSYFLLSVIDTSKVNIIAFVNSCESIVKFENYRVIRPNQINKYNYDYLLIASGYYKSIKDVLRKENIEESKIVSFIFDDIEMHEKFNGLLNESVNSYLNRELIKKWLRDDYKLPRFYLATMWKSQILLDDIRKDFVREQIVQLLASEINRKSVEGSVAELGVYKGDFTVVINSIFRDRKLYLYDTFEGFLNEDVKNDQTIGNKANELMKFKDTSADLVISRLKYPERVQIVEGYFPESFAQNNERFCFVSVDLNLYDPVRSALDIFYEKLASGGYILISDYEAPFYEGTRQAIQDWSDKNNINFIPIPDLYGSVLVCK